MILISEELIMGCCKDTNCCSCCRSALCDKWKTEGKQDQDACDVCDYYDKETGICRCPVDCIDQGGNSES